MNGFLRQHDRAVIRGLQVAAALSCLGFTLAGCGNMGKLETATTPVPTPRPKPAAIVQTTPASDREHERILATYGGSYDDPRTRGVGPSTPAQTAWGIMGLLAANDTRSDSVARGVAYLLRTQSDHLLLPEDRRERLLRAVAGAIAAHGDRIEYTFGADPANPKAMLPTEPISCITWTKNGIYVCMTPQGETSFVSFAKDPTFKSRAEMRSWPREPT